MLAGVAANQSSWAESRSRSSSPCRPNKSGRMRAGFILSIIATREALASSCPASFGNSMNGKCYRKLAGSFSHLQCSAQCRAATSGASMPCIESEAESGHLYELAGVNRDCCGFRDQSCCLWTGLTQSVTDQGSALGWDKWGSTACHSKLQLWNPGEPNDYRGGDENCAVMGFFGSKKWFDAPCEMRSACVCEVHLASADASPEPPPPPPLPPPPPPPPSNCVDGWHPAPAEIDMPDKCYKVLLRAEDATRVVPQLASLATRGWLTLRTRDEHQTQLPKWPDRPNERLQC